MSLLVWNFILNHRNNGRKFQIDNAKKNKYKKCFKYWKLVVNCFNSICFSKTMLPSENEFFGEGLKDISSMSILCNIRRISSWWYFISNRVLYWIGNKTSCHRSKNQALEQGLMWWISNGMISTFPTVLLFAAAIWTTYTAGRICRLAFKMMATTAMQLAIDAFGPISDNAGGIAEMSR
jgi:K(+)-stimulated pyrophosphate-energized sodium pump